MMMKSYTFAPSIAADARAHAIGARRFDSAYCTRMGVAHLPEPTAFSKMRVVYITLLAPAAEEFDKWMGAGLIRPENNEPRPDDATAGRAAALL